MVRRQPFRHRRTLGFALGAALAVGLLLTGAIALLARAGFLSFSGTDPSSKIVAAALTVIGAFFASVVSLLGILFKDSFDRRTEARLRLEFRRNHALARDAEKRLKLEAATQALQMLARQSGDPSLPAQTSGALFVLSSLGQHSLALSLAGELLYDEKSQLPPSAAAQVIDAALRSGDSLTQEVAIGVLSTRAAQFLVRGGFEFPDVVLDGCVEMPSYVREWASIALTRLLVARPLKQWRESDQIHQAYAIIAALVLIYEAESDEELKHDKAAMLRVVLSAFPRSGDLRHPRRLIQSDAVRQAVEDAVAVHNTALNEVAKLQRWYEMRDTPAA